MVTDPSTFRTRVPSSSSSANSPASSTSLKQFAARSSSNGSKVSSRSSYTSNGSTSTRKENVTAKDIVIDLEYRKPLDGDRGAPAPLNAITNRSGSASHDGAYRSMSTAKRTNGIEGSSGSMIGEDDATFERPRNGPRSSYGQSRNVSSRVPSALRRLPPAGSRVASRAILPSGSSSSHQNDVSGSGSSHPPSSSSSRPGVSALARANVRRSLGATLNAAGSGGAAQHERDGREITKLTVDSTSFEEWMKMATDNKINATNTWNFALIDYFHDMSLLRSDNGDGSINFQKASCTLDGCVKVWTSRVDSVVVETGKLLSGLQDDGKDANAKNSRGRNGDDEEGGEGADDDDENDGQGPKRKRNRAREPTLAKSFNQLAVKKLDLEFTVDPLFKKTSADFDEGGAGGLLMNHLGVDSKARVVFDASDVPGQDDVEEEVPPASVPMDEDKDVADDDASDTTESARNTSDQEQVDLNKLRAKLFGQHDVRGAEDPLGELLTGMTVCPTFSVFKFAPDDNTLFSALMAEEDPHSNNTPFSIPQTLLPDWDAGMNDLPEFDEDGGFGDEGLDDAFGGVMPSAGPNAYFGGEADGLEFGDNGMDGEMGGTLGPGFDAAQGPGIGVQPPLDFTTSLQGLLEKSIDQPFEGDDFFGYFDQRMTKNWAGPEHWKVRNVSSNGLGPGGMKTTGDKVGLTARKQKEPFVIEFKSPEAAITSKELFEKPTSQSTTLLPASKETDDLYLLPEDQHFSSRQLLRLFIKPRAMLNPRRAGQALEARGVPRNDADADFWVQAAAQRSTSGEGLALGFDAGEDGGMPDAPFDTQFFHEDDGGFDAMDEAVENAMALEPEDEELATQALKRIRPEYVNYAKKAKQVDIRKLKENIWRELAIAVENVDSNDDSQDGSEDGQGPETSKDSAQTDAMALDEVEEQQDAKREPTDPRTFESVLSGLRKLYSKDKMDEISTSFCFICLLHLANEEGLRIRTAPDGIGGLGMLAGRKIVEFDEEDDEEDVDDGSSAQRARQSKSVSRDVFGTGAEDEMDESDKGRVGYLEQLSIAKDPNAGRSA